MADKPSATETLLRRAFMSIDGLWLALFRIGFGACMVWQVWYYFSTDLIRNYFIEASNHFTYVGFDWVRPWPGNGMYLHFLVLGVAAMCIMLGFYYRTACAVFCLGFTHFFFIDKSWYLNHYYLICLLNFLAIFLPANRELSIDSWRYPEIRDRSVPTWTLWLLRFQLGIPYFYGGIAKINRDWIFGEPIRSWLRERQDTAVIGRFLTENWCVNGFVWGGMLLDLFVVPCLLWKPTRIPAMVAMTAFHLLNAILFDIGVFPWLMLMATVIVFTPPETIARLRRVRVARSELPPPVVVARRKLIATLLCVYASWQILMPLRHLLYPGHTAFTRQGHHFAWRMKLNDLFVAREFSTFDPNTKEVRPLSTGRVLQNFQAMKIRDVDQLLQLARWLHADLPAHQRHLEIRCRASVSLNSRPPTQLFSPEIDLLSKERNFWTTDWITLYPEPRLLSAPGSSGGESSADGQSRGGYSGGGSSQGGSSKGDKSSGGSSNGGSSSGREGGQ